MQGKTLIQSKEFWFNVVMFLVETAAYLENAIPQKYLPVVVAVHSIGNIALRILFTNQPITGVFKP